MDTRPVWVVALTLCLALPAFAQMYKWKDADGKWQYSDKPPPGNTKAEKLRNPTSAPPAAAESDGKAGATKGAVKDAAKDAAPKTAAEQERAFRKRQQEAAKAGEENAKKLAEAKILEENCARSKQALAGFEAGGRQSRIDSKGERVFLDDAEIARETARARAAAASFCK